MTVPNLSAKGVAAAVHVYTAVGIVLAALAISAIGQDDYRTAFFLMTLAVLIDATDGTLARRLHIKRHLPHIDGRKLDDIVDYLNYTFVPLIMIGHAEWIPSPPWAWLAVPFVCSALAFVHTGAKEEDAGFFLGFPSYWNVIAFYIAVWLKGLGPLPVVAILWGLGLLCLAPVRFVYPNRPPRWRGLFVGGGAIWLVLLVWLIWQYPQVDMRLVYVSLTYPVLYVVLSVYLDRTAGRSN